MFQNKKVALIVLSMLLLALPVFAEISQIETVKISGGVVDTALANTKYLKNFSMNTPDGLDSIIYAKARIISDTSVANTQIFVQVNGKFCNPSSYNIVAPTNRYQTEYDCTGIISEKGIYEAGFLATNNIRNVFVDWEITYQSNPERTLSVFGTEYFAGQNGTVFIQSDSNSTLCDVTIFAPNKSAWANAPMKIIVNSTNIYYYDFIVPVIQGVYVAEATCKTPLINRTNTAFLGNDSSFNVLKNITQPAGSQTFSSVGGGNEFCVSHFHDSPSDFGGEIRLIRNITNINMYWDSGGSTVAVRTRVYFGSHNFLTGQHNEYGFVELNHSITGTPSNFTYPNFLTQIQLSSNEIFTVEPCISKTGSPVNAVFRWGGTTSSNLTRNLGGINLTNTVIYHGSTEIHISPQPLTASWFFDFTNTTTRLFLMVLFIVIFLIVIYIIWRWFG